MNARLEKLSLPRHRRDPIFKFWQPNAKLEKIHPPVFWKALADPPIHRPKKTSVTELSKAKNRKRCDGSWSTACHYTTLTYRTASGQDLRIYVDYEHHHLQHTSWKESIEEKLLSNEKQKIKLQPSSVDFPWISSIDKQQSRHDQYFRREEFARYFQSHVPKDNLFRLDRTAYPNRPKPMSRRPRDALHVDFYQAACFEGSKTEATFKTFHHRKYLLPRHLRASTLQDLLRNSAEVQLHIDVVGHFILHPNELSKHEIKMFELTSDFGDIYEGHIIRINEDKLVLLLVSAHHSDIKLARSEKVIEKAVKTDSYSTIEQLVVDHVRDYFQSNQDYSVEQIRRLQIEFESLIDQDKRRLTVHLFTDEELIANLSFDVTYEQEPTLFDVDDENNLYFLQTNEERSLIDSVQEKLKQLFNQRYLLTRDEEKKHSCIQLTLDIEYDALHSLDKLLHAYACQTLTISSKEECMRIAIEYNFGDLLVTLDAEQVALNSEKQVEMIIADIQMRLRDQTERHFRAEETARILLMGPPMKREMASTGKEVMVLDHHREIFIARSNTFLGPPKMKNIQRNTGKVQLHQRVEGGPKSFDRLPMSIDSLTILTRSQQRKNLAAKENENQVVLLGSGIQRLLTSEDRERHHHQSSFKCEQDESLVLDQHDDSSSIRTLNTPSYNTSADTQHKKVDQVKRMNSPKKKRLSRSLAEYGRHKHKRRKQPSYALRSKLGLRRSQLKCSFLRHLFLFHGNHKQKANVLITDFHRAGDALNTNQNAWEKLSILVKQSLASTLKHVIVNRKNQAHQKCNNSHESMNDQLFHDEGFEDKEDIEDDDDNSSLQSSAKSLDDAEGYLHSLYGSLSSTMKHVHTIYQSESSRLISSLNLAHIFITFLHLRKDTAHEIASKIIHSRQSLVQSISPQESPSSATIEQSIVSNVSIREESRTTSTSSIDNNEENDGSPDPARNERSSAYKHRASYLSNAQYSMNRIIAYLSEADWRVFNYITKHFLQNGVTVTSHALEFSSALLLDLIEDSVYQMYFQSNFTLSSTKDELAIENTLTEEFLKKSIDYLFDRLQLINLPLLESIALTHTLKKYLSTDLLRQFHSKTCHPVPIGRDPRIWLSIDVLIKTICSLTDDIFHQMNQDYLSDYTKFEYLLVFYFRKIQVVRDLQDVIRKNQNQGKSPDQCLMHVIDLNQAPKFFSDQAFKRFTVGEHYQMDGDVEALKDLVLLDMRKRKAKSVKRPYIPLNVNDLMRDGRNRVVSPSPWIIAQYQRRLGARNIPADESNLRKESNSLDETRPNHLPPEVRALLENMIKKYGTLEDNLSLQTTRNDYEGLSEEEVAQLIENAIEAVAKFDRDNNIGDRKLQNRQTVNDRLMEFFKHAGRHGVRALDDILKLAKLRSDDPKKYLPLAVTMLKDRLEQTRTTRSKKQTARFLHTLETLFTTTNDEPELIAMLLKKKSEETDQKFGTSLIVPPDDTNFPSRPSNDTTITSTQFPTEVVMSTSTHAHHGLTVAQLIVLITGQTGEPMKLTDSQIEQICRNQGFPLEQLSILTKKLPDKFQLTEEQLIQITMEENISIADVLAVRRTETSTNSYHLTKNQIQSLVRQMNLLNDTPSTSSASSERKQRSLVLHLYQLIEICHQQNIDLGPFLANETATPHFSPANHSENHFALTSSQIAHLIRQHSFDIQKLVAIEHTLQRQSFRLSPSQLAYLSANRRIFHNRQVFGLSVGQLICLHALQQQPIVKDQTTSFSLTYHQIKQLALMQEMSLDHFHSLPASMKSLILTVKQLIQIVMENQGSIEQIGEVHPEQASKQLDREQFCMLINQNNPQIPTTDSPSTSRRVYLNTEQIFALASGSNIHVDEIETCSTEVSDGGQFRFKPAQLATLYNTHNLNDMQEQAKSLSESTSQFILSDEQFSSLLRSVPVSALSRHLKGSESMVPSVSTSTNQLSESHGSVNTHTQLTRPLTEQWVSMRERLHSSIQAHAEVVKIVSDSLLKRGRWESALNVVYQSSLQAIDDTSTTEMKTIPSFVIDLLGTNPMTETTYQSIRQGQIDLNVLENDPESKQTVSSIASETLTEDLTEEIRTDRLTLPQIHKIQTQLLTPKFLNQFKSGHLSHRILDAYKSQSSSLIIDKIRVSAAQLDTMLLEQPFGSSALDKESMIVVYPESAIHRQQVLEELGDRLDTQLLELKKKYDVEPTKGQASIRQITNKLRTMTEVQNLQMVLGRPMDEVDVLNILQGHLEHLLDQGQMDPQGTRDLLDRNTQYRSHRITERIQLVHVLKSDIENERLKRSMTLDEFNALVLEDISRFEQLTSISLTEDDLRIISMNRFASLERSMARQLSEIEYRHLLGNDLSFNYIEEKLLKRSLTDEERLEQETFAPLPDQESFVDRQLTDAQLKQILRKRAELVDQYDIMSSISPSIKRIEEQLNRSLTVDEKKRLTNDDYSIIQPNKYRTDKDRQVQISPTTALLSDGMGEAHDTDDDENIERLQTPSGRLSTKEEILMSTDLEKRSRQSPSSEREREDELSSDNLHHLKRERNSFVFDIIPKGVVGFTLSELEQVLRRSVNTAELKRFASTRFSQIEDDLNRPLNDQERSSLLRGDQIAMETFISRQLSPEETGPHLVNIREAEKVLNRQLTSDELTELAGDRFEEMVRILGRRLTREELIEMLDGHYETMVQLINDELNRQKEEELKALPITRIHYFEEILHRKLSSYELLRFAEDRFETISRLLTNQLKSEQILDLSSGRYGNIQTSLNRSLTVPENYQIQKSLFQVHMKYPNILKELEYVIQRRLNEQELRTLANNQYDHLERRLRRSLTEKQLRNLLQGKNDQSLSEVEDLVRYNRGKYDDNYNRTRTIARRLIEELEREYDAHRETSSVTNILSPSSRTSVIQHRKSDIDFHQSTMNLLDQLSDDVRKHAIVTPTSERSVGSDEGVKGQEEEVSSERKEVPISISHELLLSDIQQNEPSKAFESIPRIVEQMAAEERLEEMTTVIDTINKFQEKNLQKIDKSVSNRTTAEWLADLQTFQPSLTQSIHDEQMHSASPPTADEDLYLGWTLFKSVDRPELGLKEEQPRSVNVKHLAQTYVVGIPEEYADDKSRTIANRIYQGEVIRYRPRQSRILKNMSELVSQLIKIPALNDATHFIVPSRAYIDIIDAMNTYKSELLELEDDDLQTRDSPETLEWYEECIQRNVQVHAQIPTGYQPSIVYCHTGRRTIISPARRIEQRKASIANSMETSKTRTPHDIPSFTNDFIGRFSHSMFDTPSTTPSSTMGTATDLIMHTLATSQKTDLLEAMEELFSQENLERYHMTETHWQDIFLLLLNSYLRSRSTNRKDIFKRLTDQLHELRRKDRLRASGSYPSISVATPPTPQTRDSNKEYDLIETEPRQFHFGPPTINDQSSVISRSNVPLTSQPLSHNQSAVSTAKRISHINRTVSEIPLNAASNSNASTTHQNSKNSSKHRRYVITVLHSDEPFDMPSNESVKLPPIVMPKRTLTQAKKTGSAVSLNDQLPRVSAATKRNRSKKFF